jgi:6-phosphogluconolactonase
VKNCYVYVSNAEDGDIGLYALADNGALEPRARFKAQTTVMPLAVSPDRRYLVAAVRAERAALSYRIDAASGELTPVGSDPLAESFPYITFDKTGRFLLGASYSGNLVAVHPVASDGRVAEPLQVIPTARNAHAIITDKTNRFVFVPHLGTDQVFQFLFDEKTGRLSPNTPPLVQLKPGVGPRHLVTSPDNRFVYVLNELTGTITTLSLDADGGRLTELGSVSALPADVRLRPGAPRPMPGREVDTDTWASDLHLTPDGRYLYAAERTSSSIGALRVDPRSGALTYLGSTPTEKQPRGFAIDPSGRFMVVSGEKSPTISSYAIDAASGALRLIGKYPTGKGSNWVEIVLTAR